MIGQSIRTRLLFIALMPSLVLAVALGSWSVNERVRGIAAAEQAHARSLLDGIALASEYGVTTGNTALLESIGRTALPLASIVSVRFSDEAGNVLASVGDIDADTAGTQEFEQEVVRTNLSAFDDPLLPDTGLQDGNGAAAVDGRAEERVIGRVTFVVDSSRVWRRQLDAIWKGIAAATLLLTLVGLAAWRLALSVGQPLRRLHTAIDQVARQEQPTDLPLQAHGEVGELAVGVSQLSEELDAFHRGLKESTRIATQDLQETLSLLESRNLELIEAREVAERASASKSTFLANMSHEIRTPMNVIVGTLSMLRLSSLDDVQRAELALIDQSSRTLLKLIDDILDISKIEGGHLELESIPTDIGAVLGEVATSFEALARERRNELKIEAPDPDMGSVVLADPLRLKQILFNLVSNALKFTSNGVIQVVVSTSPLDTNRRAANPKVSEWCFSVIDTGVGIPADKLDRVFRLFTQADMSTTRHYGGSGLGLYICRELVEKMQGRISVQSSPGQGTRFDVVLPFASTGSYANEPLELAGHEFTKTTQFASAPLGQLSVDGYVPSIMAIDDHPINLGMLQRFFDHFGVTADLAGTAADAKYFLQSHSYDLILMDLHMPGEDGFYLVDWLRSSANVNSDCAVLAVTADAFEATRDKALAAGFDAVLTKPVTVDVIGAAIEQYVRAIPEVPDLEGPGGLVATVSADVQIADEATVSVEACAVAVCGDMEWAAEALANYRDSVTTHIRAIENAHEAGDSAALFQSSHAVKGVSDVCRITRVSVAANLVCEAVSSPEDSAVTERVSTLVAELRDAERACTVAIDAYRRGAGQSEQDV